MWLMWFPLDALRYPASLLIFNYFDGSSQTLPFSIRKYISFRSCRVAILLFFNKYSLSVLQCNFYKVCFYQVVCVFSFSFFIILFFFCFQRSQFQLGVSESIGYIFNKQDPLFYKRFISRASNISMITSACSSADGKKKKKMQPYLRLTHLWNLVYNITGTTVHLSSANSQRNIFYTSNLHPTSR